MSVCVVCVGGRRERRGEDENQYLVLLPTAMPYVLH